MTYQTHSYTSTNSHGEHTVKYYEWGTKPSKYKTIVGVQGLTCPALDFEWLGKSLAEHGFHFYALELAGRGESDLLSDAED